MYETMHKTMNTDRLLKNVTATKVKLGGLRPLTLCAMIIGLPIPGNNNNRYHSTNKMYKRSLFSALTFLTILAGPVEAALTIDFTVDDPSFKWYLMNTPDVAVGYTYSVTGGPLFDMYQPYVPPYGSYDLFGSTDACSTFTNFLDSISGNAYHKFETPAPCFAVKGIDVAAVISPTFESGFTFDSSGVARVTQTSISKPVYPASAPGPLPLLGFGAAFAYSRKLRNRVKDNPGHS